MFLKESYFLQCWKISSVVSVFENVGERCMAKSYNLVSLLSVISKVYQKIVNNRHDDHLQKCAVSDFQYFFRFSRPSVYLLTVAFDRIAGACNRSGAT